MKSNKKTRILTVCFLILKFVVCIAQTDSTYHDCAVIFDSISSVGRESRWNEVFDCSVPSSPYRFRPLQLIVPGTLIGVGIIGLESDWLQFKIKKFGRNCRRISTVNSPLMILLNILQWLQHTD